MILSFQTLACDKKPAPLVERVKGFTGNYVAAIHVLNISAKECSERPSIDHHDFCTWIIVLVYMTGIFALLSNVARAMHPGQNQLFKDPSVDV